MVNLGQILGVQHGSGLRQTVVAKTPRRRSTSFATRSPTLPQKRPWAGNCRSNAAPCTGFIAGFQEVIDADLSVHELTA